MKTVDVYRGKIMMKKWKQIAALMLVLLMIVCFHQVPVLANSGDSVPEGNDQPDSLSSVPLSERESDEGEFAEEAKNAEKTAVETKADTPVRAQEGSVIEMPDGTITFPFTKTWDDNQNEDGKRPTSIKVKLTYYQGTEGTNEKSVTATVTGSATADTWTYDFVLPDSETDPLFYGNSLTPCTFKISEESIDGYAMTDSKDPVLSFDVEYEDHRHTPCDDFSIDISGATYWIAIKKGNDYYIWTPEALSPMEQKIIHNIAASINGFHSEENFMETFLTGYGKDTAHVGFTVDEQSITFGKKNTWSMIGWGTYVRSTETNQCSITNKYQKPAKATIEVEKVVENAAWPKDASLVLTLSGKDGAPVPENNTVKITEAKKVEFPEIAFTAAGTYVYTISEGNGFGSPWTSSGDVTATVTVAADSDGKLNAEVAYSNDGKITNTYHATGTAEIKVTKEIKGTKWPEGKTLTFTLSGEGGTLPETKTVELTAAGTATFDAIKYTEADIGKTYEYTISEDGFGDGWTGSGAVTATVKVTDAGNGELNVEVKYSPENATITNTYKATGEVKLEVTKTVEGAAWPQGKTLTFTLSGEGGTLPETKTAELRAAGKATFGAIKYTEADIGKEYTYTISEDGFGQGWSGSDDVTVTVKITDAGGGKLNVDVKYSPENATITNTYKAMGEAELEVTKVIEGAAWPEGKTLTFTLSGEGGTLPETKTVELTAAGTATFDAIKYTEADIGKEYTYTISEDGFGQGWSGSDDVTATVKITDAGGGKLNVEVVYSPEDKTITNTYKATGEAKLEVTKVVEGAAWPEGKTLTFTLSGEGGTLPEAKTVELTAAGTAAFDAISYTEADIGKTYTYTISEDGFGDGWTGSGDVTATVKITDNGDGTLKTEINYSNGGKITNTYKETPPPVKTGDSFRKAPFIIAMTVSGLAVIGVAAWLVIRKKQSQTKE